MSVPVPGSVLTHSRCVWLARELFLAPPASAKCHKYFPLFRNGSGLVAGESEGGEDGWMVGAAREEGKEGGVDEKSEIND